MKDYRKTIWIVLAVISFFLVAPANDNIWAEETSSDDSIGLQYNWFDVNGDKGRFRQDWRLPTGSFGGISDFESESADGKIRMGGHAIFINDFSDYFIFKLPKDAYFKMNGKYFRQFYDGSNEPWDPTPYLLSEEFADWQDGDLFADRFTQNFEYGRALNDNSNIAFGYDVWWREGRERLLRGELSAATGQLNRRAIPNLAYIDGVSHTWYVDWAHATAGDYNISVRPSFELYKDYQDIQFYRYNNGVLNQDRTFYDSPQFQDASVQANIDKFVSDNAYIFSGYTFDYLHNGTVRSEVRPVRITSTFTNPNVDNERFSHTGNLGTVLADLFNIKNLRLGASTRIESADSKNRGYGFDTNNMYRFSQSDVEELWTSEALDLAYSGVKNLNLGLAVDFDQRRIDYDESLDAAAHEIFYTAAWGNNPPQIMNYNADILYNDFRTTARANYRVNKHVKLRTQYRYKDQDHDYDTNTDSSAFYYPGILGDTQKKVHEVTAGTDVWLWKSWMSGFTYQYIQDDFETERSGKNAQELTRHRFTASLSGQPLERLSLSSSATMENFQLLTPTAPAGGTTWLQVPDVYDYDGSYFIYNLNGAWTVAEKSKVKFNFQQTAAIGTQENFLTEASVGFVRDLMEDAQFSAEYIYFDFNDKNDDVPGFDDYFGNGVILTYENKF